MMRWLWVSLGVVLTSVALVVALTSLGLLPVRSALAGAAYAAGPWRGGPWHAGGWAGNLGFELPPELESLRDVPADQRFGHFLGAQVRLRLADGSEVTANAIPGTITAASDTELTMSTNDGTMRTFTIDEQTIVHGKRDGATPEEGGPALAPGDRAIVLAIGEETVATAVVVVDPEGVGGPPWAGGWCPFGFGH